MCVLVYVYMHICMVSLERFSSFPFALPQIYEISIHIISLCFFLCVAANSVIYIYIRVCVCVCVCVCVTNAHPLDPNVFCLVFIRSLTVGAPVEVVLFQLYTYTISCIHAQKSFSFDFCGNDRDSSGR